MPIPCQAPKRRRCNDYSERKYIDGESPPMEVPHTIW